MRKQFGIGSVDSYIQNNLGNLNKKNKLSIYLSSLALLLFLGVAFFSPLKSMLFNSFFPKAFSHAATLDDWNMIGHDPEHTGYSAETLGTNFKVAWTYPFQPDRVFPAVQAIVYNDGSGGKVFIGTEGSNGQSPTLYALWAGTTNNSDPAFNANAGKVDWKYVVGGPIISSAAADNGMVYVAAMDGVLYAIHTSDGSLAWKDQLSNAGFSTSPIIANSIVYLGGRDGNLFAVNPTSGNLLWKTALGGPVLQTPAFDNGNLYVGAMDMYVYAVNATTGVLVWKSSKILGISFKEYYPVITAGKVIITAEGGYYNGDSTSGISPGGIFTFGYISGDASDYAAVAAGNAATDTNFTTPQTTVMNSYTQNPSSYHPIVNVLDENTGTASAIPQFDIQQHNGVKPPPCVDSSGNLVLPAMFIQSGWGRLNLTTQRFIDVLYDGTQANGSPYTGSGSPAGMGNDDENETVACSQNLILGMHIEETNANYTGAFNLTTHKWTQLSQGNTNRQMFNNTQSGGANPASVSNGMFYHIVDHELVARSTK